MHQPEGRTLWNIAILIDGAPEIALSANDRDDNFVKVLNIISAGRPALQRTGVVGAEFQGPSQDRFVGDEDATLKRHLFDKAQVERKSVALVADGAKVHGDALPAKPPQPTERDITDSRASRNADGQCAARL
jgi:hypothetical protein